MNIINQWLPISKVDEEQRMVYGNASTWGKDSQGEVVEKAAIEGALPAYMRFANIREMHQPSAVGVTKSAEVTDDGLYIGVKVVDDSAWNKVKEGVYKGFSIGGKALSKIDGVIKSMILTEISLVDRPANPGAVFDVYKRQESPIAKYAGEEAWDARRAIECLGVIYDLHRSEAAEQQEPQAAEQLGYLEAAINGLKQFIQSEIAERTIPEGQPGETEIEMAAKAEGIAKAGATYSSATKEALSGIHEMLKGCVKKMDALGYMDDTAKADEPTDIAKSEIVNKLESENSDLKKRLAELEAQPAPAKAAAMAIAKSDDGIQPAIQKQPTEPIDIFKMCLSNPI